jgi:hypothetical protein
MILNAGGADMAGIFEKRVKLAAVAVCLLMPLMLTDCGGGGGSNDSGTGGTDTAAPTVPANLAAAGVSTSQINLTWVASSDNVGVAGYKIYRDGTFLKTTIATTAFDAGLGTATQHCYSLSAYDAAGNESAQNGQVCAQTLWALSTIDSAEDVGQYTSIAVDSANKVHISYEGKANTFAGLGNAVKSAGSWATSDLYVGGSDESISWTSIAMDANNKSHIIFVDSGIFGKALKYTTDASGSWVTTAVAMGGTYSSLATDASGTVHISYHDETGGGLLYLTNAPGSFVTTTIDGSGTAGLYTCTAVDSNGKVHISYHDAGGNGDLKYATNASGSWATFTVDSTDFVGEYSSLALDSNNKVHISYYDSTNGNLKYATNASGAWIASTIDSTGYVGLWTSIAVDANNKVHISYYDSTNGNLKYATNKSGSWVIFTVDSTGDVGAYSSLAIDSNNIVHISYYDSTNGDLKYATNE